MTSPFHDSPFRVFAEHAKDATVELVRGLHGARDPSPMVILDTPDGIHMVGVDAAFFRPDLPERRRDLIGKFILPMIREHGAWRAAIVHAGWLLSGEGPNYADVIVVTAVDGEVSYTWWAPREDPDRWREWPANRQTGLFVTPIQEALR